MGDMGDCEEGRLLEACELDKIYGEGAAATHALRGVSFELCSGEFAAVVGQSGSGKSTLLNLLGLLDSPTAGTVRYNDTDARDCCPRSERAALRNGLIGFVFQFHYLLPEFSVYDNVAMPAYIAASPSPDERDPRAGSKRRSRCSGSQAWAARTRTRSPAGRSSALPLRVRSRINPRSFSPTNPPATSTASTRNHVYELFREINAENRHGVRRRHARSFDRRAYRSNSRDQRRPARARRAIRRHSVLTGRRQGASAGSAANAGSVGRPATPPRLAATHRSPAADRLPAPIARITVAAPVTMSPPAYTPGIDVAPSSSVTM